MRLGALVVFVLALVCRVHAGPVDPAQCIIHRETATEVVEGREIYFIVEARDSDGNLPSGGVGFDLEVKGHTDAFYGQTNDLGNGRMAVHSLFWFSESTEDKITFNVRVNGVHIRGSPLVVPVRGKFKPFYTGDGTSEPPYCQELVVVSGSDSNPAGFWQAAENFIGSMHFWEPKKKFVYYDLGMDRDHREFVQLMDNVELRKFDFKRYGAHVKRLESYAWKPLIIKEMLQKYDCVLWLDSGAELRQPLDEIWRSLQWDGHWFTTNGWRFPNRYTHPGSLAYFGLTNSSFDQENVPVEAAGGLVGFDRRGTAYTDVLIPWVECCLREECVVPPGATKQDHRQDQTVLNIIRLRNPEFAFKYRPHIDMRFWASFPEGQKHLTADETQQNKQVLFLRRRFDPKPYTKHIRMQNATEMDKTMSRLRSQSMCKL